MQQLAPQNLAPTNVTQTPALQLNDIHLPEQISNYPLAIGWWLLAIAILIICIWLIKKTIKNAQINQNKKRALAELSTNKDMNCSDTLILLKWAAMQYFNRHQLAKLYGEQFQQFLLQQLPLKHQQEFNDLTTEGFTQQYQKDSINKVVQSFNQGAVLWLKQALPPKKIAMQLNKKSKQKLKTKISGAAL